MSQYLRLDSWLFWTIVILIVTIWKCVHIRCRERCVQRYMKRCARSGLAVWVVIILNKSQDNTRKRRTRKGKIGKREKEERFPRIITKSSKVPLEGLEGQGRRSRYFTPCLCTVGHNQVVLRHRIIHFPTPLVVSEPASEWMSAAERASEASSA